MDWNHLRAFLETAQSGSLSAAARRLRMSQPTLGRQVAALEAQLGVTLFERVGRSLQPTDAGLALLEHARAMGAAADEFSLAATGQSQVVEGFVSVSASDAVSTFWLPPIVRRLKDEAPGITVEIVASNAIADLRRREADIALRHVQPDQPDLISRRLPDASAGFYASTAWVARHGHPRSARDAAAHAFVGGDRDGRFIEYLRAHGVELRDANISTVSENSVVTWQLVQHGLGIGVMVDDVAATTPNIVRVLDELPPIRFPMWLVTHRELRTARRIRVVFDVLARELSAPQR
ncbi:MAG: LysR family transcriptional regulator [Burkholderiales bacterium]|nr:LysR family transcriptional regulator [Burkholderiales bacterium]